MVSISPVLTNCQTIRSAVAPCTASCSMAPDLSAPGVWGHGLTSGLGCAQGGAGFLANHLRLPQLPGFGNNGLRCLSAWLAAQLLCKGGMREVWQDTLFTWSFVISGWVNCHFPCDLKSFDQNAATDKSTATPMKMLKLNPDFLCCSNSWTH